MTAGRRVPLPDSSSSSRETPNVTISLMHRCQSAAADLTHCRPLGALTKELVQKHTYEQEMAYMRSWKRRKSAETNQVNGVTTGTKRPLEPCPDSDEPYSPFKIPRQESQLDTAYNFTGRPASMPVLQHLQQYYTTEAGGSADRVIHRSPERNVTIEHYSSNRRFGSNLSSFVPEERRSQALQVAQNFLLPMTNFTTNLNNNNNNIDKTVEPFKIQPAAKVSISETIVLIVFFQLRSVYIIIICAYLFIICRF